MSQQEYITVNEIYQSIQGESTWAGLPCVFVRLTGCNLRCTYCDTEYAFYKGQKTQLDDIFDKIITYGCPLVEITGGEPLLQKNINSLMTRLCDAGKTVLIETSGSINISTIDPRVHIIMDLKCPSSGELESNLLANIEFLCPKDELKFVIGTETDYRWAAEQIANHKLGFRVGSILFSPVFGKIDPRQIVEWILRDKLPVRFQLQLHKFIWPVDQKGV